MIAPQASHSANRKKGNFVETHAAAYLMRKGYSLLTRNYAYRGGELDIIAQDKDTIVFVEVKSVWSKGQGNPAARVTAAKQRKIWKTAWRYLDQNRKTESRCRFDVLSVKVHEHPLTFTHYQNAFEGPASNPDC